MPGIGIITNPHSKLNKRNPKTPQLLGYILGEHGRLEITRSLADLGQVANKFRDAKIEILAINGGDGTIARTLRAIIEAYGEAPLPKIALLRGGTMNVLAANLGIRGRPEKVLYRLVESYSILPELKTVTLTSLKVEDNYGFLFADGVAYQVLDEFYKNKTGALGAAWLVLKICISTLIKGDLFRKLIVAQKLRLLPKGFSPMEHESCTVMAATIEKMPFGFRLFPLARRKAEQLQFFSVTSPPDKLLRNIASIMLRNKEGLTTGKVSLCCDSLTIEANSTYQYTLDGELYTAATNEICIRPGPRLEFIVV